MLNNHDALILQTLQEDCRISLTEISKKVGLSRFAVKDRIENMFNDGIILGPTVVANPLLLGFNRTVFFEFKTNPHEPWLARFLEEVEACDMLDGISGEYSLFGRFRVFDDEHFSRILKRIDEAMSRSFFKKYRVVNAIRVFKESGVPFKKWEKAFSLDEIDRKILEILLNQSEYIKKPLPLSTAELSRLLHKFGVKISQPAVFKRLTRLERGGVILRHTLRVDAAKLGLKTKLIVRVKVNPNAYDVVAHDFLALMRDITDLYRIGEEYGLLAIVRVRDISEYNSLLLRLYDSKDVIETYTTLVLEERKNLPLSLSRG